MTEILETPVALALSLREAISQRNGQKLPWPSLLEKQLIKNLNHEREGS